METCQCERCGCPCRVSSPRNPDARLLRRSAVPKGYCVDCAATQFLMNTYPCNMLLDENGPGALLHEAIQEQFAAIMQVGLADARPDEIRWDRVVANWDLSIRQVGGNPMNPYTPTHPKRAPRPSYPERRPDPLPGVDTITSFEQLDALKPGLGDDLRKVLDRPASGQGPGPGDKPGPGTKQGKLF